MALTIYLANDNTITLDEMTKGSDGTYVTNATVTAVLKTATAQTVAADGTASVIAAGTTVATVSMPYVTGSNASYQGSISYTSLSRSVYATGDYELDITATGASGYAYRAITVRVLERTT